MATKKSGSPSGPQRVRFNYREDALYRTVPVTGGYCGVMDGSEPGQGPLHIKLFVEHNPTPEYELVPITSIDENGKATLDTTKTSKNPKLPNDTLLRERVFQVGLVMSAETASNIAGLLLRFAGVQQVAAKGDDDESEG